MTQFKKGDRVVMITGDGWAQPGDVGVVTYAGECWDNVSVCWDDRGAYSLWHKVEVLGHEASTDPNTLFKRRQHGL